MSECEIGAFPILGVSERTKELFDLPIVAYKRPKNLRDLLVQTRPPRPARDKNTANGTRQCGSARCKTCAMVQDIQEIQFADQPGHRGSSGASSRARQLMWCTSSRAQPARPRTSGRQGAHCVKE